MAKFSPMATGLLLASSLALATTACAGDGKRVVKGAAIGGAGGAVVGAVVPGISTGEGALIGAAGGAVVGALGKDDKGREWYRDSDGRKYYIDKKGRRHYK
ncbi:MULTISPECIES: YMGG-like glycine zipper-containing protein [Sphingomonadales]|uniref:YMGG-like Gly-zipper domain-containing protein n=2 Tax=Edaphosphingomonas TaxID=3423724 RepID=A0A1S1HD77_9SPHN|nr:MULTISPECIES: YMGG-like glycine zipper-containing protein [Sphingomonas]AGH47780.1 hypothetical protein G432_00250 [Sphingomonas sp. MM-1]MDX3882968.1 YMGG-like glycine zipper-containing protein [Sphingomonas sp.]OHT20145.1 hypothetical protein BHE75_02140 [Sphingomonas haloaromaticamans]